MVLLVCSSLFLFSTHLIYVSQDVVETCSRRLENITRISYNLSSTFSRAPAGGGFLLCHVAARASQAGLANGRARVQAAPPPPAAAHGTWRSAERRRRKSFFCGQEGLRRADWLLPLQLCHSWPLFSVSCRCPGARKSSAGLRKKGGLPASARGRAHAAQAPTSTPGWKLVPDPGNRATACGDPGRARSCGTTMGAPRLRALAAARAAAVRGAGSTGPAKGGGLKAAGAFLVRR